MESQQQQHNTEPAPQRLRTLLRQNSEKFGFVAENVVLPMNKRSIKSRDNVHEMIPLDVEAGPRDLQPNPQPYSVVYAPTSTANFQTKPQPAKEFPIFMISISIIQALIFYYAGGLIWLALCYDPFRRHELWRYFTIMLVHSSASHLWGNLVFQLILGVLLETVHHWKRVATIYVAGVLGGSLAITVLNPESYGVGASAGVYALLIAHLATIIMNWNEMDKKCCRLFWLLLYIGFDVGLNVYVEIGLGKDTNTSHAGHFGGAVTGFIVAVFALRNFEKLPWEMRFQKILAVGIGVLVFLVVVVNIAWPSHYYPTVYNTDYEHTYVGYVISTIHESEPESELRKVCEADDECKALLEEHARNNAGNYTMEYDN